MTFALTVAGTLAACGFIRETIEDLSQSSSAIKIISVAPSSGPTSGGTALTVTGAGFHRGATVSMDGLTCQNVEFISDTELRCSTPTRSPGMVTVTVTNPDSQSDSKTSAFEYTAIAAAAPKGGGVLVGGGVSTGGGLRLQGSVGELGTPYQQSGGNLKKRSGVRGILQ